MEGRGVQDAPTAFGVGTASFDLIQGARNLLGACAELRPGQALVVFHEDPDLGWFDLAAPRAVAGLASEMGASVDLRMVGGPETGLAPEDKVALARADVVIWFARIGDQDRFQAPDSDRVTVVSYARTAHMLASGFGTRPHAQMIALKEHIDAQLTAAKYIEVTCPLGTELRGSQRAAVAEDVTVRRFPMCVPRPVLAAGFSGKVALAGFLTPTGSRSYEPASVRLSQVVLAHVEHGAIVDFQGDAVTVDRIRKHYNSVASKFDISPEVVHSWHAGLHQDCVFNRPAAENPDLWSNSIFGSPRWLHFHTCGNYAPGEICWMIERPTVIADQNVLWSAGQLTREAEDTELAAK